VGKDGDDHGNGNPIVIGLLEGADDVIPMQLAFRKSPIQ
jgi:hypothetical protein